MTISHVLLTSSAQDMADFTCADWTTTGHRMADFPLNTDVLVVKNWQISHCY